MSQVKRYDWGKNDSGEHDLLEFSDGDYVKYADYEALLKEVRLLTLKTKNSLANNLCPDHRDKQAGKGCLACEVNRLQKENQELIEAFVNYPTWTGQKLAIARNPDVARSVS